MDQEVDLRLTVHRRWIGADGVVVLDLRDPAGAQLPCWSPGAHVDLTLPGGLTRQYSLCGEPGERRAWRIGVLREPAGRGGSAYVHDHLPQGATVEVRGPRNHFALVPAARYLFLAGGIGITPILAMTTAAARAGADWELHYGGRARASMAFLDDLGAAGDRVTLYPQDEVGLMDLDGLLAAPRPDTAVYCCGPEPLLAAVERHCAAWPPGSLHIERFTPRDVGAPVRAGSFEITLAASGRTLTVPPDRSILEVVEAAGVSVLSSCQEGTCGTCETAVLAGEVDHRDSLLTPDERAANDTIFLCVSRAACSRLVLDL
ncbi:PDR/VanB family oxidoreductase [Frankia sp. AgB32]|nr:PDR/VanB family oxidoreductase [Frankia sp. AgB32]MCK9894479.1 PDR/VanB family oxidoreductase [Frankia sp. AgB32]